MNKQFDKRDKKQSGVTLIEILAVIVIASTLVIAVTLLMNNANESARENEVINDINHFFPAARNRYSKFYDTLDDLDDDKIVELSPMESTQTPCGDTWSSSISSGNLVVQYPLSSCPNVDTIGAGLESVLRKKTDVSSDTDKTFFDSNSGVLQITYLPL